MFSISMTYFILALGYMPRQIEQPQQSNLTTQANAIAGFEMESVPKKYFNSGQKLNYITCKRLRR
jgi:hypothetical protein